MMMANSGQWSKAYGAIQTPAKPPTGIPNIAPTTTPQATDWWNQFLRRGQTFGTQPNPESGINTLLGMSNWPSWMQAAGGGMDKAMAALGSLPIFGSAGQRNPWASPTPGPKTGPVAPTYPDSTSMWTSR